MRIGLVATDLQRIDARRVASGHASTRLRALIPATGLGRRGHGLLICSDRDLAEGRIDGSLPDLDVLILHKSRLDLARPLDRARAAGAAVVIDLCDDVFVHPVLSAFYPAMLAHADLVTAATKAMAEVAAARLDCPIRVIADAVEGERGTPEPAGSEEGLRLVWFGRAQNLGPLIDTLPALAAVAPARLDVITNPSERLAERLADRTPDGLSVHLVPWSPRAVEQGLSASDLALLPADPGPAHRVKSANRLERAIWGGCMAVANPLQVTEPWADVAYLDPNLVSAISRALADRTAWPARIRTGQERLARTRSADALAVDWEAAAAEAVGRRGSGPGHASPLGGQTVPV